MSEPITFTSRTPRLNLPLLFSGQSQKEFFVNESLSAIDAMIQPTVEGFAPQSPMDPLEGQAWIIGEGAEGDWSGLENSIATFTFGDWHVRPAQVGMIVYDKSASRFARFEGSWQTASDPTAPSGGSTIDAEARLAVEQIIDALRRIGVFSLL